MEKVCRKYVESNLIKASMTLELSMLMPGIMMIFIFIIYLSFFYHDKCVIERKAYLIAENIVEDKMSFEDFENDIDKGLLGKWTIQESFDDSEDKLSIMLNGTMFSSDNLFFGFINNNIFDFNTTVEVYRLNEPDYVRRNNRHEYRD